jgi:FkbM family methyltransferase
MTLANGVKFRAYPDCVISSALHYADWPEYTELQFCRRHLRPDEAVFDVGANVGHFSLLLADSVSPQNFYCFEPAPVSYKRLSENFELNGWPVARLYRVAVGQCGGVVEFPDSPSPDPTNSAVWSKPGVSSVKTRMVSLDSLVPEIANSKVGLLKIDVEGSEREVFLGAKSFLRHAKPRLLMFESLSGRLDETIGKVLSEAGYVAFKLDNQGRPVVDSLDAQNLFATPKEFSSAIHGG